MFKGLSGKLLGLCALPLFAAAPVSAETVALSGATLIDGTGAAPVRDSVIVMTDGRITTVGPRASVSIPAGARTVNVSGKTIMPGIVNAHAHVEGNRRSTAPLAQQLSDQLALYARYGVTTVYSLGDDGVESVKLARETRHRMLSAAAARDALLIGTHFPTFPAGRVVAAGDAFRFDPIR